MFGDTRNMYLPIHKEDQGLGEMTPEWRRKGPCVGAEEVGDLTWEVGELIHVKGGDVGEEQRQVGKVLGDGGVRGGAEGGLVVEKIEGGLEVAVEE